MFSIVFGSFGLAGASGHVHIIQEGRIAGKLAFGVIEHIPDIDVNQKDS
jgi:hypothetical protein